MGVNMNGGNAPQEYAHKKHKKYKILWNRVIIAAVVLLVVVAAVIWLIASAVSAIFHSDDSSAVSADASAVQQSSSLPGGESSDDPSESETAQKIKVVLDAGHGGNDVGSVDATETRQEKDDTLKITLAVKKYLEQNELIEVILTRSDDVYVSLDDRCSVANSSQADLFVSLHRNKYDGTARGVEIWVNNKKPVVDSALAQNILDGLKTVGISEDRGVQYGYIGNPNVNYQVNRATDMPSCLVELGFIQDDEDNRLFDEHCDDYAKAIADAVYKTACEAGMVEGIERTLAEEPPV